MTIPNADHLFELAERFAGSPPAGPPRQVNLRRAVSTTYYGLFHFTLAAVADEFVGVRNRNNPRYALVYRSIAHRTLKEVCGEIVKRQPAARYAAVVPAGGFDIDLQIFATVAMELQERRHAADYDPLARFELSNAKAAIDGARDAVQRFPRVSVEHRRVFLTLLLCPPR